MKPEPDKSFRNRRERAGQ